jgi:histidinol dehydrogenase
VKDINEAMMLSNLYAPEHLILQVNDAEKVVDLVQNAGSVFVGAWTPESVGDYSAGVNHSLRKFPPSANGSSTADFLPQRRMDTPSNIPASIWARMLSTSPHRISRRKA